MFFLFVYNDKNIFESFLFQTTSNDNVLPLYCWPVPNDVSIIFNAVKSSIHISIDSSLTKPRFFLPSLSRWGRHFIFNHHSTTPTYAFATNSAAIDGSEIPMKHSGVAQFLNKSSCAKRKPIGRV